MPTDAPAVGRVFVLGSYAAALVMTTKVVPRPGETVLGRDFRKTFGGKGSDIAVQAARLGAQVNYIGVIGDDDYGHEFHELLDSEGISSKALRVSPDLPTGIGFIIKDEQGENLISVDMGANAQFSVADVDAGLEGVGPSDVVIAQLEIPLDTALYGLQKAKESGATTILNPAPAVDLTGRDLSFVDVLTPNNSEARTVVGRENDPNFSDELLAQLLEPTGVKSAVITKGGDGVTIISRSVKDDLVVDKHLATIEINLVDSNGAGDSFNAGLGVGLLEGKPLENAADFGSVVASIACEGWETVFSYQHRSVIDERLRMEGKL